MADDDHDGSLVDLSDQNLTKLEIPANSAPVTVIADRNSISRLENIEQCQTLRQPREEFLFWLSNNSFNKIKTELPHDKTNNLSLAGNRLIHVNSLSKLRHLAVLNLPQNSIVSVEGLRDLTELQWLNLSGNSIKSMEHLATNTALRHLDLSDNSIAQLGDIHLLNNLKTLLLHGNSLTSVKTAPHFLPKALVILSLAENEILDINEVSFLSCLSDLQQLSIMNNPCVLMTASDLGFDYRPFVVNWCPCLQVLDGYMVSEKEMLKAEWLYSQGKGHHFKLGQHLEAVQYLSNVCPLTASVQLESNEDAKLSKILHKQRYHQQQLQQNLVQHDIRQSPQQQQDIRQSPQQQQQQHQQWNVLNKSPQGPAGDTSNISPAGTQSNDHLREPVRAWAGSTSVNSIPSGHGDRPGQELNDLSMQDVTSEGVQNSSKDYDRRSTSSLLDSESTYLPVDYMKSPVAPTPNRPMTAPTVAQLSAPATSNFMEFFARAENRPATAIGDNKYDAYDKRPIKPLNQEMFKGMFKPDFNVSQPQLSGNEPVLGTKKRTPPTAQAMDYDTSQDSSQIEQVLHPQKDREKENVENIPAEELNLIKNAAEKKVRKTSTRTKTEDKRTTRVNDKKRERTVDSHITGAKRSIPVAKHTVSRTQSDYIPGKYSASRRPATAESDTRTKGKMIKTIPEKVIGSDRLGVSKDNHNNSLRDSGIYSRPTSDAVLAEDVKAATKIQSFWRGYWAREHVVEVVRVRREIRARRAEEHIVVLRSELERQRKLYDQERQLRTLQLEAIRQLWKEVQSLQTWKSQVLSSQMFKTMDNSGHQDFSSYNYSQEIQNTLARAEMINNMNMNIGPGDSSQNAYARAEMNNNVDMNLGPGGLGSGPQFSVQSVDLEKQKSLEKTCESLQTQVSQLQEALHSMSSIILQNSVPGSAPVTPRSTSSSQLVPSSAGRDPDEDILVTDDFDDTEVSEYESLASLSGTHWGTVPHSLSPYPSEEEEAYFRQVPQPGFPTPPRGLKLEHRGKSALVLRWQQSKILDGEGKEINKPLLGYRVFVNDKPKAMIAGTKQKALIEGLDPTLTYKIYVKAVSPLGESNSSDVVMAALSKGQQKRRSSSSDSNHSESDRESTESERRHHSRKDRKSRKTKSPRSSRREKGQDSSQKEAPTPVPERPVSRLEQEAGVIMTPKLHTHRRNRSKDLNKTDFDESLKPKETLQSPVMRSPKTGTQESQGFSFDSRQKIEDGEQNEQNLSSTFTIDSQNSVLLALSAKSLNQDVDSADSAHKEENVTHRRRRSRERKGEVSDSSSSVSSVNVQSRNLELSGERNMSGTDSPSTRRRRSRESTKEETESLQRSDSKTNSAKISPTAGSQGVPVIDGRKRHGSGSRPSSPACSDISDSRSSVADRRRLPVGELLEQRFSGSRVGQSGASTGSSTATLTQSQVDNSINDLPPQIPRRDPRCSSSMENLSSRTSCDYNRSPTEKYSPTGSERRRTSSTSSETDLASSTASRQLDMDKKNSNSTNSNSGIVAKLLQKLQTFSKNQEESLRTTKYKRKPGDSAASDEERVQTARKTSGDSDISDAVPGKAPVHSDSSSGAHSDDQQAVRPTYRTHRRTASDHRPIKLTEQPPSSSARSVHSPVIMDGAKSSTPQPTSSNNIKRHASFHGILPSKKEDLVRSGSHENLSERNSQPFKHQNIEITVPTTPTRRQRHRSRSRSPGPNSPHVPIISAAQLQRQSKTQAQAS